MTTKASAAHRTIATGKARAHGVNVTVVLAGGGISGAPGTVLRTRLARDVRLVAESTEAPNQRTLTAARRPHDGGYLGLA